MPYNRYELKCYSNFLIVLYAVLAGMVDNELSFKR